MIYGLLSIVIKKRRILFLISILAYCSTLFIQTDIYISQRTLVWGVCFMLRNILSEIHLDKISSKKFLLFFIVFDLIYMLVWFLFYEIDSKKIMLAIVIPDCGGLLL